MGTSDQRSLRPIGAHRIPQSAESPFLSFPYENKNTCDRGFSACHASVCASLFCFHIATQDDTSRKSICCFLFHLYKQPLTPWHLIMIWRNHLIHTSTNFQVSQIIICLDCTCTCWWSLRRTKDVKEENAHRVIIELRSRGVVVSLKFNNILIPLHNVQNNKASKIFFFFIKDIHQQVS